MSVMGTQPTNVGAIMGDLANKLQMPGGAAPGPITVTDAPTPQGTPPTPQVPPQPRPMPIIPNVSAAKATADASRPLVEFPDFGDDETPADPVIDNAPPAPLTPATIDDLDDDSDLPLEASAVNFKKLRDSRREERKAKRQLELEHQEIRQKLETYERGEAMPEVLQAKDKRIQELEKYEVAFDGQLSREYQELVVQPIKEKKTRLTQLSKDYGIPEEHIETLLTKIVETDNVRDRNALISKYFPDQVGSVEVNNLVKDMHDLGQKAIDLEQKPHETRQGLIAQYTEKQNREKEQRATAFESISKSAWNNALEKTAKEGVYRELIVDAQDPEFTKNTVEPLQQKAALQYGALVKTLSQHGLQVLPQKLADGLARMVLLSIGGANVFTAKDAAERAAATMRHNNSHLAGYLRPNIGNSNGAATSAPSRPQETGPRNPKEAGQMAGQLLRK